jgi:pSer/pThr/pTyr-binding forkhead associated (FHA) protein
MQGKCDESFDASEPALIVTYGNTTRKRRRLDRDVLLIGQNRACDIGLVSPEIAPIHCLVIRSHDGFRLRDCGSRCGTRINGKAIQEAPLHDTDAIQIGPFSFQAYLPGSSGSSNGAAPVATSVDAVLPRLQRSRRNLVQLALRLRRRLHTERVVVHQSPHNHQAEAMRERAARSARLEEAERCLAAERARHEQEVAAFNKRVADMDQRLAEQQANLENSGSALVLANELEAQRLAEWRRQLEEYAAKLELARQNIVVEEERLTKLREQIDHEKYAIAERERRQRQMMEQAETSLRDQREALTRMMAELKQLHQEVRTRDAATIQLLRQQNDELRAAMERCGAAV